MGVLLVPVDFSENSLDAVQYAFSLLPELNISTIVLYHSNTFKSKSDATSLKDLESIGERLKSEEQTKIVCIVNKENLITGLSSLAGQYQVSLIVMGITGRNKVGQKLIGSNVFQVSENAGAPVLIIPAQSRFQKIENVALALPIISDLQIHTPKDEIKTLISTLGAKLMIVNVGRKNDRTPKPVLYTALKDIFDMFDDMGASHHFLTARQTADSIADFARDNNAQLLISISGNYGVWQGMFQASVTKKMAYHSTVPLLIYRSGDKQTITQ